MYETAEVCACIVALVVLGVAPLGEGLVEVGHDELVWEGEPGRLVAGEVECGRFGTPVSSPDHSAVAVWAGSDSLDCIVLIRSRGVEVLGPWSDAGLPAWDDEGVLWYTADGELWCGDSSTGIPMGAHHVGISSGGDRVVFTDRDDRLLSFDIRTGETIVIASDSRYYGPEITPGGSVFSPTLEGVIRVFTEDGAIAEVIGEQPVGWLEGDRLLFVRTEDDGHRLLGSDLWTWRPGEEPERLTDTPGVFETRPCPIDGGILYVDAASGTSGFLEISRP